MAKKLRKTVRFLAAVSVGTPAQAKAREFGLPRAATSRGRGVPVPIHPGKDIPKADEPGRNVDPSDNEGNAPKFCRRWSGWVCFVQVRALRQSEMVALGLAESDAVVTS